MTEHQQEMYLGSTGPRPAKPEQLPPQVLAVRAARIIEIPQLAVSDGQPRQLIVELEDGPAWLAVPNGYPYRLPNPGDYAIVFPDGAIGWLPRSIVDLPQQHYTAPPAPEPPAPREPVPEIPPAPTPTAQPTVEPVPGGAPSSPPPDHPPPPEAGAPMQPAG